MVSKRAGPGGLSVEAGQGEAPDPAAGRGAASWLRDGAWGAGQYTGCGVCYVVRWQSRQTAPCVKRSVGRGAASQLRECVVRGASCGSACEVCVWDGAREGCAVGGVRRVLRGSAVRRRSMWCGAWRRLRRSKMARLAGRRARSLSRVCRLHPIIR